MKRKLWTGCLGLGALLLAAVSAACGAGVPSLASEGTPAEPIAASVLAQARTAMEEAESYRFTIEIANEQGSRETVPIRTGEWAAPDHWLMRVDGEEVGMSVGGQLYFKDHDDRSGPWQHFGLVDQYPGLVAYPPLLDLTAAELTGRETVDGVPIFRVAGMTGDDPGLNLVGPLEIELLVREADYLPVRMVINPEDAVTFIYSDFNAPISIESP